MDGQGLGGRLAVPLVVLIMNRIRGISHRFARIVAQNAAGTYVPRRSTARRRRVDKDPRRPNPLPQGFAWLIKPVPEAAAYGSQLQFLFAEPEMAALLAAAPTSLGRPLRSLCRTLGVTPPAILAAPAPADPPPAPPQAAPAGERPAPPPLRPRVLPPPSPCACGPPAPRPA